MIQENELEFIKLMKVTADMYNKEPLSIDALKMFFLMLHDYSLDQVQKALGQHIQTSKFMPTVSDIIARIDGTPEERATRAWPVAVDAVRYIGSSNSVAFPEPAFNYALSQMGGWVRFCNTLEDAELKWRGREFERFYITGIQTAVWFDEPGKIKVERYCIGTHEQHNRRGGYALPDVIDAQTRKPIPGFRENLPAIEPNAQTISMLEALVAEKRIF